MQRLGMKTDTVPVLQFMVEEKLPHAEVRVRVRYPLVFLGGEKSVRRRWMDWFEREDLKKSSTQFPPIVKAFCFRDLALFFS